MVRYPSRKWPIVLGVVLVLLIVALLVIWIIAQVNQKQWTLLVIGSVFFGLVLIGVVIYFILTIKEVNLSRRQANFIDAVTHELKSPIASIKLCLQTLDMRQVDQRQQQEFHRFMLEDVQRLDGLIDHLLVAARLDHVKPHEEEEDVLVEPVLRRCLDVVARQHDLEEDQIQVDIVPCYIRGNSRDLEIILSNLLDNAAKYAANECKIHVSVQGRGADRILLRVSDNGRGVRFELRRKIFQRFFRGGSELVRTVVGTGLGLYLVRSLVKRAKGKISVNSRGPLSGATFEVELPGRLVQLDQDERREKGEDTNDTPQPVGDQLPSSHS